MSFTRDTRENGDILLYDDKGGCVSLRVEKDYVRLQDILMPDGFEQGAALLGAAGTDALQRGIKRVICDFSGEQEDRLRLFKDCGYELSRTDRIISVKTKELLSSVGVKKSMRKQFAGVECLPLEDLIGFQRDEIVKALAKHGYMESREQLDRLDQRLSTAAYDDNFFLRAVLFVSCIESRILVELLFGFSAKPQYTLSVCQRFVKELESDAAADTRPEIHMLTVNDTVIPLLKRLLNKEYKISEISSIIHGQKDTEEGAGDIADGEAPFDARLPVDIYRDNINTKYRWRGLTRDLSGES